MPRLGLSMVEGTIIEWRVRAGEPVTKGDIILVVESEKAEVEIEAFASGVLAAIYADVGATVPIGTLLGAIVPPGEPLDAAAFAAAFVPEVEGAPATAGASTASAGRLAAPAGRPHPESAPAGTAAAPGPRPESAALKAAPAARALARRIGVDLATVPGTGPGGRITVEDVERFAPRVVRVNGTGLSVATAGVGPALLLISGYGVDASGWRRQVEALRSAATVVTYDHRGIGDSWPIGDPGLTIARLADDAHALLAHLGHLPAVVVGASLGAAVALELALRHAAAVRALVLLAPVIERDARFEAVLRAWCAFETPQAEARIRAMLPWLLGRAFLAHAGRREAAAATLRAMAARTPLETLRLHGEALLGWLDTRTADLHRIVAPTLVAVGADDALTPPAQAEAVARGLPRARLEVLAGAGHAVMIERVEAVNAFIRDFVTGIHVDSLLDTELG